MTEYMYNAPFKNLRYPREEMCFQIWTCMCVYAFEIKLANLILCLYCIFLLHQIAFKTKDYDRFLFLNFFSLHRQKPELTPKINQYSNPNLTFCLLQCD